MDYKGYKIEGDGTFGYHKVKLVSSGTVPKAFSGLYTTPTQAKKAIDSYLSGKPAKVEKEVKNDTAKSASRGKQS